MTFFDRLYADGVVRESGHICQCLQEDMDGIAIADELRKVFCIHYKEIHS